jgi:hypothetical protein
MMKRLMQKMVGEIGFEPTTPWTQTRCATKLRHSPTFYFFMCGYTLDGAEGET